MASTFASLNTASLALAEHAWGGGWWFGPLIPLLWIAAVGVVVWLVTRRRGSGPRDGTERARGVLAERYARGELTTDEYRDRLANLG